jgi:hypothetical protein
MFVHQTEDDKTKSGYFLFKSKVPKMIKAYLATHDLSRPSTAANDALDG